MDIHPADKVRSITLDFGKTGMGKTVWAQQHVKTLRRVIVYDPLGEYRDGVVPFYDVAELIEHCAKYRVWRVSLAMAAPEDFPMLCRVAQAAGNCTLVVEEAQRILPPGPPPPSEFTELVYRGRHTRTSLLIVSQRPSTVHIAARSQWTRIVSFSQSEVADVEWMRKTSGFDALVEARDLPRLHYFDITPGGIERKKLALISRREIISPPAKPEDGKGEP